MDTLSAAAAQAARAVDWGDVLAIFAGVLIRALI